MKEDFKKDVVDDHRSYEYYNSDDVDVKWKLFEDVVREHADYHCPIKKKEYKMIVQTGSLKN